MFKLKFQVRDIAKHGAHFRDLEKLKYRQIAFWF